MSKGRIFVKQYNNEDFLRVCQINPDREIGQIYNLSPNSSIAYSHVAQRESEFGSEKSALFWLGRLAKV